MKKLIDYFLENSLVVNLITVSLLIIGTISAITLKKEMFPDVSFDTVIISTSYPGSTAEDVESLVSIPLERKIKGIDGIKQLNVLSAESNSIIWIQVEANADIDELIDDLRSAVDSVTDLPEEAKAPVIREAKNTDRGIVLIPIFGGDEQRLRRAAKDLRDELERIPEVSRIEFGGYREDQIKVEVNPQKLNQYQLTIGEVAKAIQGRNLNLSAGKLETKSEEILVRTNAEFETAEDVAAVVVRSNFSGRNVIVGDVANVSRKVRDDKVIERANGERAIFLDVKKRESADIIKTIDKVKAKTEKFFERENYKGLSFNYTNDLSYYVKRRLGILTSNGFFGLLFVFICLMLFLNFRTSFLTSMGAPLAFMTAFIFMDIIGISINLISMFGLIMVLGMLVDDAIIVAERFYHLVESGLDKKEAARQAALSTVKPVTATIITTMLAFCSFFFMGGIMGKFLWPVPAIVILCLFASWLECFFILPNHLADFSGKFKSEKEKKSRWYEPLQRQYEKHLRFFLKAPLVTAVLFFLALVVSVGVAKKMPFELFPGDDVREIVINLKGPIGTPLEKTDSAVSKVEELTKNELNETELKQIRSWVGRQRAQRGNRDGNHYGTLVVYLTPPDARERSTDEILDVLSSRAREVVRDFEISTDKRQGGPPKGKDLDLEITGDSLDDLKEASGRAIAEIQKIKGVISPEIDFEEGKKQVVIEIDEVEAKRLGLTTQQIAFEFRRALAGDEITKIRESDEDIEIVVQLQKEHRQSIQDIEHLYVLNNVGRRIDLKKVVTFKEAPGAFVIRRKDAKRTFSILASLDKKTITPVAVANQIRPFMESLTLEYPGLAYNFGGENEDTKESMTNLTKAMLTSVLGILFVLILMFRSFVQPLLIMSAIPLGFIGVIITFKLSGWTIGFMAFLGMVGLVGVVVNDSIVLVNFINKTLDENEGRDGTINCIVTASVSRLRAVILTTVTTVVGLLPIALAKGGDPFLKPMALSFAGGLFFSTVVTLIFIPNIYLIYKYYLAGLKRFLGGEGNLEPNSLSSAGVTSRVGAVFVDMTQVALLHLALIFIIFIIGKIIGTPVFALKNFFFLAGIVAYFGYFILSIYQKGSTIGLSYYRIKLIDNNGNRSGRFQIILRLLLGPLGIFLPAKRCQTP